MPIAPFTIPVAKYNKEWIICMCCNEIWTSSGPYDNHIVKSGGKCAAANQLIALEVATGLKFNVKAKEQTNTVSIQQKQQEAIIELHKVMSEMNNKIKNLENRVFKIGCCKCAPAQNTIIPPSKPVAKPPPVISDSEDDDDEEEEKEEELPVVINPKFRCKFSEYCGEIGNINAPNTDRWIDPCLTCKTPLCSQCVSKRGAGSKQPHNWFCSQACRPKK